MDSFDTETFDVDTTGQAESDHFHDPYLEQFGDDPQGFEKYLSLLVDIHDGRIDPDAPFRSAALVPLHTVTPESHTWLWHRWVPARALTLLGGYSGDGKSTVMASLIAAWTTGGTLPDDTAAPQTSVLMLSAGDDITHAVRPRLDLHGADPERVVLMQGTTSDGGTIHRFDLARDVHIMRKVIDEHAIGLVVIDPLTAYLPGQEHLRDTDVRDALQPLMTLIEETGVAVIGVMQLGKLGDGRTATQRALGVSAGAAAYTDLARSVILMADQPEDRQTGDIARQGKLKVLEVVKSNYTIPPVPMALRRALDAPITWLGMAQIGIDACIDAYPRTRGPQPKELHDAMDFLRETLKNGPVLTLEVAHEARTQGFSERTLRRAKKKLGVIASRTDHLGPWQWHLPHDPDHAA